MGWAAFLLCRLDTGTALHHGGGHHLPPAVYAGAMLALATLYLSRTGIRAGVTRRAGAFAESDRPSRKWLGIWLTCSGLVAVVWVATSVLLVLHPDWRGPAEIPPAALLAQALLLPVLLTVFATAKRGDDLNLRTATTVVRESLAGSFGGYVPYLEFPWFPWPGRALGKWLSTPRKGRHMSGAAFVIILGLGAIALDGAWHLFFG